MRRRKVACGVAATLIVSVGLGAEVRAAEGARDPSFGTDGIVTTHIGPNLFNQALRAIALDAEGRIVVAGEHDYGNQDFVVARYLSNGSLDADFAALGRDVRDFAGGADSARAVAVQSDGKIVVAGIANNGANDDFGVIRYRGDGTLDRSFGVGGKVSTPVGTSHDTAASVAVQSDGKILVAGTVTSGTRSDIGVVRYLVDGTLDSAFGTGGKVTTRIGSSAAGYALVVQPDGKIVVVGSVASSGGDFAVVRYRANGSLDPNFATGGIFSTDVGGSDEALAVALQSNGKIVVSGYSGTKGFAVMRLDQSGALDAGFGAGGIATTDVSVGLDVATSVAVQRDGKIVLAGTSEYSGGSGLDKIAVARFTVDGVLDAGFGTGGKAVTDISGQGDQAWGMVIQPDGDIVVAGSSFNGRDRDFAVVRYIGDEISPSVTVARVGTGTLGGGAADALVFTLSEPSTTFDVGDVTVANGTLSEFTGSGALYTASLTSTSTVSATITVDIDAGRFTDLAGNPNTVAAQLAIPFDPALPSTSGAGVAPNIGDGGGTGTGGTGTGGTANDVASGRKGSSTQTGSGSGGVSGPSGSDGTTGRVAPKLRVRKTVTLRAVAIYAGLEVPKRAKLTVAVAQASRNKCTGAGARLKGVKVGRCKVTVTVRNSTGKKSKRSVLLQVTR